MQGEHKYAHRPNGAWTKRSASPYRADKFRIRRRSCCDALRHTFANLAPKYRFTTCISAAYRDTFLRTACLWRSSRGGTDQIYRGRARAKFARLNFTRSLPGRLRTPHLYAARRRIRDAKMQRRKTQQRRKRPGGAHETNRKAKRLLGLHSRKPSKIGFFKISPARRSQKSAFKIFSPAQILKSAL